MSREPALFVGVDASTTAVTAIVWSDSGQLVAEAKVPLSLRSGDSGKAEQDPEDWYQGLLQSTGQAIGQLSSEERAQLRGLAIANQRESYTWTDAAGQALGYGRLWLDQRCKDDLDRQEALADWESAARITGKRHCPTPSIAKILHQLHAEPNPPLEAAFLWDVHGYLVYRLTGNPFTSLASADPLGIVDLKASAWYEPLTRLLTRYCPALKLPRLRPPAALLGTISDNVQGAWGLKQTLKLYAGAGDGQAAALGAGISADQAYLNLGTAWVGGTIASKPLASANFRTLRAAHADQYFLETDLLGGMHSLSWLQTNVFGAAEALHHDKPLTRAAEALSPGADGVHFVPHLLGVMNPDWNHQAGGQFSGLRAHHSRPHLLRAVWEGLCFEQTLAFEAMFAAQTRRPNQIRLLGGGSKSSFLCQMLADCLGVPLGLCQQAEATSLGAAMLAALGSGHFETEEAMLQQMAPPTTPIEPGPLQKEYQALANSGYAKARKAALSQATLA